MNGDRTESASEEHAVSVSAQSVRLWRFRTDSRSVTYRPYCPESVESEPGMWRPKAQDEAREAVVAAARAMRELAADATCVGINVSNEPYGNNEAKIRNLCCQIIGIGNAALSSLDALTKGDA